MVVAVEESERLLLEEEEAGVQQLEVLGQVVQLNWCQWHAISLRPQPEGDSRSRERPGAGSNRPPCRRWCRRCHGGRRWAKVVQ